MCTLIVSFRPGSDWPLVVAANRDERLDRASSPPCLWSSGPNRFIAPCDEAGGGTWLGLNSTGLFVGITNRFGAPKEPSRESRGQLVVEALAQPTAAALHAFAGGLSPQRFNGFHLLYADDDAAFLTWSDGQQLRQRTLDEGVHVVTERSLGGDDRARRKLALERWWGRSKGYPPAPADLEALLSVHTEEPLDGTCQHLPQFNFGTRSSCLLFVAADLAESRLRWAEGPPCTTPFGELPELIRTLTTVTV